MPPSNHHNRADPGGSSSDLRLSSFISSYQGVGTVDEAEFTTP